MESCRQLAGWSSHLHVAINISARQLKSDAVLHSLAQAMLVHGVAADRIEVEITETALIADAALTGLRKKEHTLDKRKRNDVTCYHVVAAA